jgi:hypothetical protein
MLIFVAREFKPFNQGKRKTRCRPNNLLSLIKYTRKERQSSSKEFTKLNILSFPALGLLLHAITALNKTL